MGCSNAKTPHASRLRSSKLHSKQHDVSVDHFTSGGLQTSKTFSKKKLLESDVDEQTEAQIAALEKAVAEQQVTYDECWGVRIAEKSETLKRTTPKAASTPVAATSQVSRSTPVAVPSQVCRSTPVAVPQQGTRRSPTALADLLQAAVDQATSENAAARAAAQKAAKSPVRIEHTRKPQGPSPSETQRPRSDVKVFVEDRRLETAVRDPSMVQAKTDKVERTEDNSKLLDDKPTKKLADVLQDTTDNAAANNITSEEAKVSIFAPSGASSSTEYAEKASDQEQIESFGGNTSPESTEPPKLEETSLSSDALEESLHAEADITPPHQAQNQTESIAPPSLLGAASQRRRSPSLASTEKAIQDYKAVEEGDTVNHHQSSGSRRLEEEEEELQQQEEATVKASVATAIEAEQTVSSATSHALVSDYGVDEKLQRTKAPTLTTQARSPATGNNGVENVVLSESSPTGSLSKVEVPTKEQRESKYDRNEEDEQQRLCMTPKTPRKATPSVGIEVTPPKLQLSVEERPLVTNSVRPTKLMTVSPPKSLSGLAQQAKDSTSKEMDYSAAPPQTVTAPETLVDAPSTQVKRKSAGKLKKVPNLGTSDMVPSISDKRKSKTTSKEHPNATTETIETVSSVAETAAQDPVDPQVLRPDEEKKKRKSLPKQVIKRDSAIAETAARNPPTSLSKDGAKQRSIGEPKQPVEGIPEAASQNTLDSQVRRSDDKRRTSKVATYQEIRRDSATVETALHNHLLSPLCNKDNEKDASAVRKSRRKSLPPVAQNATTDTTSDIGTVVEQGNTPAISSSNSLDVNAGNPSSSKKVSAPIGNEPLAVPRERAGSSLRDIANGKERTRSKKESQPMDKPIEFKVTITRGGAKLGLEAETNSDGTMMLVVHHVREGPVLEWNRANPSRAIRGGDMIVEVNGIRGNAYKVVPVMEVADPLELVVRRIRPLATPEACHV